MKPLSTVEDKNIEQEQEIIRSMTQESSIGSAEYFTGNVRVDPLFPATQAINAAGAYVTFEAGARSHWHSHPGGQRLIVTSGIGLTQERGKQVQEIHVGDVIWCPPGVEHWHGASPNSPMTHIAMSVQVEGNLAKWMEKVSDEEYHAK